MSRRNYNVFFNTHTVSGIVISVALYIIFFAGAFALLKDQITIWQEGNPISYTEREHIDYDTIFEKLDDQYDFTGRNLSINLGEKSDYISISIRASKDSLATKKGKKSHFFYVNIKDGTTKIYSQKYSLGEFLYRLHFFAQLPRIGIYLSGLVAFFFLFAIVTGVIVHWKKIIPNFYAFNPRIALKRVWTDAHTALGIIGLPFQFIFAVTGAYFCLSILVLLPANVLYDNDRQKLSEDLRPGRKSYEWTSATNSQLPSLNELVKKATAHWDNFHLTRVQIKNYRGTNMKYIFVGKLNEKYRFIGLGRLVYDLATHTMKEEKNPHQLSYIEDARRLPSRLHYADFGGISLKLVYFVLSLMTCFVIITGVLIWIESRNKNSMTHKQRLYTTKVGHTYLSICLSMLPVTALSFLFVKLSNGYFDDQKTAIYWFYFSTWLVTMLFFRLKRDNYFTNKYCLLSGAILGFLIPIANGFVSGNWIWISMVEHQFDMFLIDLLWIVMAFVSLLFYSKTAPKEKMQSTFNKNPIDYKNISTSKAKDQKNSRKNKSNAKKIPVVANTYIKNINNR